MKNILYTLTVLLTLPVYAIKKEIDGNSLITIQTADQQTILTTTSIISMLPTLADMMGSGLSNGAIHVPQSVSTMALVIHAMDKLLHVPIKDVDPTFFDHYSYKDIPAQTRNVLEEISNNVDTLQLAHFINALDYFAVDESILSAAGALWVMRVKPWYNIFAPSAAITASNYNITDTIIQKYIEPYEETGTQKKYSIADLIALKEFPELIKSDSNKIILDLNKRSIISLVGMYLIPFSTRRLVEIIDLAHNYLTSLSKNDFDGFIELKKLVLIDNNITYIEPGTFSTIAQLNKLELSGNKLSSIAENTFGSLPNLFYINLGANQLATIANNTFAQLPQLHTLFLYSNKLKHLSRNAFANQGLQLRKLNLEDNNLSDTNKERLRRAFPTTTLDF
ncbi:MAG TPA: leucine-rich repeat domain-containing protein [Candidatus Dependentiae bacterium]|nr:leucine-rich repeat domain-containing protein [Candidatus Dependentiae bacterium]HRQ62934.1 leucine-rich repeat domain-containing protein [Candidatus Dependentiae bacterium]